MIPPTQPIVVQPSGSTAYSSFPFRPKDLAAPQAYYDTERLAALAVYAETGNTAEVERQTGVPRETVRGWVEDESSQSLITDLRATVRYNHGWSLAKMVGVGLAKLQQAFEEGDEVVLKDGRIITKRQSLRDLAITTSILIDKWMLISGGLVSENALMGKMDALASQLAGLGGALAAQAPDPPPPGTPIPEPAGENLIG